jgi:hypothetical protein
MKLRSSISGLALAVGLGVMVAGCGQVNAVRAQKAFKDANKLYAASDWRAAAAKYEEAIQLNPENAYSHFFLANCLDNMYRPTRAGEPAALEAPLARVPRQRLRPRQAERSDHGRTDRQADD